MTWTAPSHVTSGAASSAQFNAETVDNLQYLYDFRPYGILSYAKWTGAATTGIGSTATDVTGLSLSVTVAASRLIRISSNIRVLQNTLDGFAELRLLAGATVIDRKGRTLKAAAADVLTLEVIHAPSSSGSVTYKAQLLTTTGTLDTLTASGAPVIASWLIVEDVGHA